MAAVTHHKAKGTILVVDGFHRLSAPAVIDDGVSQGFDLNTDIGVQRGLYAGWNGRQVCFDKARIGREGPGGLGYGGDDLAGHFIAGNDFDCATAHVEALQKSGYNIVSCSSRAVENGLVRLSDYDCVDFILGLEKHDSHTLVNYKTVTSAMQEKLREYTRHGGRLVVSGAYISSDMKSDKERAWLESVLKINADASGSTSRSNNINGLGTDFDIYRTPNHIHYAAQQTDVLSPAVTAFCAMRYADGSSAATAYDGPDYKCFTAGFPLECITDKRKMSAVLTGILQFVMK